MKNNIKENYLGLSFLNQLKIYDKFLETLQIKKNKKVLRSLKDTFDNHFNFKINLHEAINNITYLNKNELEELKNDLLEQIRDYESYDDEEKDSFREKIRCFNYHLGSLYPFGTCTNLNKMLFFPEKLTDADTDLFIKFPRGQYSKITKMFNLTNENIPFAENAAGYSAFWRGLRLDKP